ncbi:MAG: hypothetical protein U0792_19090 [Gemmataceae bacterium]
MLLFLSGGSSHIEFFDPKMIAPEDVRSMTGETKTKLPGITSAHFHQARQHGRQAVVQVVALPP